MGIENRYNADASLDILEAVTANETIKEAMATPDPESMWLTLWYEGEICCLFSDTNLGKSIYAVQIAEDIARRYPQLTIALFDLELSPKQFQLRYTESGGRHNFPDNFYRVALARYKVITEEMILKAIENFICEKQCKVIILDNITWLCNQSDKGDAAGSLMMSLTNLKFKYGLSLLVVAHTPKRSECMPLSINDLAGSRKLANFFDSVFAIGKVLNRKTERYVIQLKCRFGAFTYDKSNVLHCEIVKEDAFTHFKVLGTTSEKSLITEETPRETATRMINNGTPIAEVAAAVGKSEKTIYRWFPQKK